MTSTMRCALMTLCLGFGVLSLPSCSVDPHANKAYGCSDKCKSCVLGFCLDRGGSIHYDASVDAGGTAGNGGNGGNAGIGGTSGGGAGSGGMAGMGEQSLSCDDVENGSTTVCYEGNASELKVGGICEVGLRTCMDGFWSACDGQVLPAQKESCNGLDDDCDGKIDEDISAKGCTIANTFNRCATGFEVCKAGEIKCFPEHLPQPETCDAAGIDEDCDGKEDPDDDDLWEACYPQGEAGCTFDPSNGYTCVGACHPGVYRCKGGAMDRDNCDYAVTPALEDGCTDAGETAVDDDCDGQTDEDCHCTDGDTQECYNAPAVTKGVGPCKAGEQTCTGGEWGACVGEITPLPETCDNQGEDTDCNGVLDDVPGRGAECMEASETRVGECAKGVMECHEGALACKFNEPIDEICGNGKDDNCNGQVDEGFDLQTDKNNCGSCGNQCAAGLSCCNGTCVNLSSNSNFCGSCSNACASNRTCCNGACVNLTQNDNNCGMCGRACIGAQSKCCNSTCVNPNTSNSHCGTCNNACGILTSCKGGSCAVL